MHPVSVPTLMVVNHSSWWDGLLVAWLSEQVLYAPGYAWMHRHNLARLPFFRLVGAFGIDRHAIGDIKAGVQLATRLLTGEPCALWIFPQGDEQPLAQRPLAFAPGSARIARRVPKVRVVPVAFHYAFGAHEKPLLQICFGAPLPDHAHTAEQHAGAVETLLNACATADSSLATLAPGHLDCLPTPVARDPWATRMLSRLCEWYLRGII